MTRILGGIIKRIKENMQNKKIDCIIIGAGPAGMMAAGIAAERNKNVVLLEKMKKPGLKLGITGKGRCNITNMSDIKSFLQNIHGGKRFIRYSLYEFFNQSLVDFFTEKGLETVTERGKRVYPKSGKALEVVGALKDWLRRLDVKLETGVTVQSIKKNETFRVTFAKNEKQYQLSAKNVIIATGGKTYPKTGSTGDGYGMAKQMGHQITRLSPALTALNCNNLGLNGLKLKNVSASLWVNNKKLREEFGEMFFTDFGLDGPIILKLSHDVIYNLKQTVTIKVDLKPALSQEKLKNRIVRDTQELKGKQIDKLLRGLLPTQLVDCCMNQLKLDPELKCSSLTTKKRKKIINWMKNLTITIDSARPMEEAIVTAGGIDLTEINKQTMESKLVKNLFFAGEVMDIDGETGGYNLQMAFSTGYIAGRSVK